MAKNLSKERQAIEEEERRLKERRQNLEKAERAEAMKEIEKIVQKGGADNVLAFLRQGQKLGFPAALTRLDEAAE